MADDGAILVTGAAGQLGAVGRTVTRLPLDRGLPVRAMAGLSEHLAHHLMTMAALHRAGRYDRMADGIERVTGAPPMSVREFVSRHADQFR